MPDADLPYHDVPSPPASYSAGGVLGRLMDGLGFRFHWATEGLTERDLAYRVSDSARSCAETLKHVHDVVEMIEFAVAGRTYIMPPRELDMSAVDWRRVTLGRVAGVSERLKRLDEAGLAALQVRFQVGDKVHEFPFWNVINGTISDGIYHVGQVVSFRRASGNPVDPTAHVFLGRKLDARA